MLLLENLIEILFRRRNTVFLVLLDKFLSQLFQKRRFLRLWKWCRARHFQNFAPGGAVGARLGLGGPSVGLGLSSAPGPPLKTTLTGFSGMQQGGQISNHASVKGIFFCFHLPMSLPRKAILGRAQDLLFAKLYMRGQLPQHCEVHAGVNTVSSQQVLPVLSDDHDLRCAQWPF
jgi:hypothetical protein